VVLRRSIRMVVPRSFSTGPLYRGAGCYFLERTSAPKLKTTLAQASASSTGGPGPVYSFNAPGPSSEPSHRAVFGLFLAPRKSPNSGQTSPAPVASTGGRSGHSGTLQGATGGTQTHSRRTGSKLGRLHCARQGLVRVPESNTKYGGKGRKTGVNWRPLSSQVSVSPQGFPSQKIVFRMLGRASPRCSQANYLLSALGPPGLASRRLRSSLRQAGLACRPADGQGAGYAACWPRLIRTSPP
jgi:hypothetical protein